MKTSCRLSFAMVSLLKLAIDVDGKVVHAKTRASVIPAPHGFAILGSYTLNFSSSFQLHLPIFKRRAQQTMADYDSDSSGAGDDIETNVLLGYVSKEPTTDDFSQVGGRPVRNHCRN